MSLEYRIGDVFDRMAEIPDGSIDLIVTSPPFLALRSYLPADHPDKAKEIGSEPTPAEFIDTLLALTAEFGRVLAPHGSICVELGDTFAGTKVAGVRHVGDDFDGQSRREVASEHKYAGEWANPGYGDGFKGGNPGGKGWPLAKSLTGIPTLYTWSLAYGRNLLTGQPSPAGQWRIRNVIVWARPNPPVGALGDKFRPATSYITVACKSAKRYFDLDAVRTALTDPADRSHSVDQHNPGQGWESNNAIIKQNPAGAPPLDWHADDHPEDGDWLWKLSTQPYKGSHYATYPLTLPKRLIEAMCPQRVCMTCGVPSTRIVGEPTYVTARDGRPMEHLQWESGELNRKLITGSDNGGLRQAETLGWTDCGCGDGAGTSLDPKWRTGVVLDPFDGSGTTLEAAQAVGRHAIGIDLDSRNADLAQQRVGMFLSVVA